MFWLNKLWLWRKAFNSHTPNIDWNRWRGNNWAQNNTLFFLLQIHFIQFHSVSLTCMFSIWSTSGLRQLLQLKEISFFEDNTVSVSWVTVLTTTGGSDTVQLVSDEQVWSLEYIHSFFVKLCDYKFRIHVWTALVNTSYRNAGSICVLQDTETRLKCRTKTKQQQDPMNWWFWNDSCPNEVTLNLILWCPTWLDQLTFVDGKYWKDSDWLLPATRNNKVENKALLNLPPPGIWQAWSYSLEDFMQKLILTAARPHYYRRIISRKIFKLVDDWKVGGGDVEDGD